MAKIRIIKRKKKTPKERLIEFVKTSYGKKVLGAITIIVFLIILLFALKSDPTGYYDHIGKENRNAYIMNEIKAFQLNKSKDLQIVYKDGFCIFAVHKDSLIYSELYGNPNKYFVEWNRTKFKATNNQLHITLPVINNLQDSTRISSRTISIKNDHYYSFNSISGTNIMIKAEIERHGDYGDLIIIGIQERTSL